MTGGESAVIKPLEWHLEEGRNPDFPAWVATTPFSYNFRVFKTWWGAMNKWGYVFDVFYDTESAAKAAAQADYERRIRSMLDSISNQAAESRCEGQAQMGPEKTKSSSPALGADDQPVLLDADKVREALENLAEEIEGLYHRAAREFDLPNEPCVWAANAPEGQRWSCPYYPTEVAQYVRSRIDQIVS